MGIFYRPRALTATRPNRLKAGLQTSELRALLDDDDFHAAVEGLVGGALGVGGAHGLHGHIFFGDSLFSHVFRPRGGGGGGGGVVALGVGRDALARRGFGEPFDDDLRASRKITLLTSSPRC